MVGRSMPPCRRTSSVPVLAHQLAGPLDHAPHPGLAHEHVVRLFGQHEAAGARERVEAALGQAGQLVLAVPVGEVGEHQVAQPVGRLLVEGPQDARPVAIARAPLQHGLRLLAPVAAEVGVEQVHHGPEVPPLLHVDLEEVAQVVERRAGASRGGAAAPPRPARCRPGSRSGGAGSPGARRAPPARPAGPCSRRS